MSVVARALDRTPAPAIFLASGLSLYLGSALAVGLFAVASATEVGWARMAVAAVVLLLIVRPWRLTWTVPELIGSAVFGLVLGGMNLLFYVAIDYLPLGVAVAIEFTGPVVVAAWGSRSRRSVFGLVLAVLGVAAISLTGVDWSGDAIAAIGLLAALAAGAAWAVYMVLGRRIASQRDGIASLSIGMTAAALGYAPIGVGGVSGMTASWPLILAVIGVGILSSVLPYTLDQVALTRLSASTFALLTALLPATATLIGLVVLGQLPSLGELAGLVAISVAVALATRTAAPPSKEGPPSELPPG